MTIHAGVIGMGIVSERIIAQFMQFPEIELVAVCDVDKSRIEAYVDQHPGIAGFTDYRGFLDFPPLNLVYIATPPSFHSEIVVAAMKAGKHVLCEKPLANSMEEADAMLAAATESGKVHALHFPLQYSPQMHEFERLYREGYVGELRRVEVIMQFPQWPRQWQQNAWVGGRKQGGYTLEVGVHFIQSVQRVFGLITDISGTMTYPEDEIACETAVLATGKIAIAEGRTDDDRTANDREVTILFNGFSQAGGKERIELNAYGTDGTLSLRNWGTLYAGKLGEEPAVVNPTHQPTSLVENLVRAIHGDSAVLCDFQVGWEAQRVLEALRALN